MCGRLSSIADVLLGMLTSEAAHEDEAMAACQRNAVLSQPAVSTRSGEQKCWIC